MSHMEINCPECGQTHSILIRHLIVMDRPRSGVAKLLYWCPALDGIVTAAVIRPHGLWLIAMGARTPRHDPVDDSADNPITEAEVEQFAGSIEHLEHLAAYAERRQGW